MIDLVGWALTVVPLDVPVSPSPLPGAPTQGNGFAAGIVGGFFGLGIVVLAAVLLGLKPRRARPPRPPYDRG